MRNVVIAMWVLGGAAVAGTPDPKAIPMPDDAAKDACVVRRSVRETGNGEIEVASGKDGEVARRAFWSWDVGKLKRADLAYTNTWTAGRLTRTVDQEGHATTYVYDDRGLVTEATSDEGKQAFAWHVKPIHVTPPILPAREDATLGLPKWLPFTGTVEVTTARGSKRTSTYDAHGMLVDPQCKADANGKSTTCKVEGHAITMRWSGATLTGFTVEPRLDDPPRLERSSFVFTKDGRISEIAADASTDGGKTWTASQRTTFEYRCKGTYAGDGDARWPR